MTMTIEQSPPEQHGSYRWYVVWLLFAVYVFNFVDRQIMVILMEPIRLEFGLSDSQLGMLSGLAFAVFYSTLGIPIARLADRGKRVNIIAISIFIWSLATALTGLARNFTQLLLARIAVGIGEAGCSPPAHSLLADYFDPKERTRAFSIYSMGIYGGVFVGFLVGGQVADAYGWRTAFWVLGVPGIVLALVVKLTLREPDRRLAPGQSKAAAPPPVRQVLADLWTKPAFRHLALAAALHAFVGYGVSGFHPSFLVRTHGFSIAEVGTVLSIVAAVSGIGGTWLGGYLADRMSNRRGDVRWQLWVPAYATLVNVPLSLLAYTVASPMAAVTSLFFALACGVMYLGPTFATLQRLVTARERALGSALLLLIINLVGLGLGPWLVGWVSDAFNQAMLGDGLEAAAARAQGLRWALIVMVTVNLWSFAHYLLSARTLARDSAGINH